MEYLWEKGASIPDFPSLEGDKNTDVLVIGGGLAGILCAKMLDDAGISYILAEGKNIGKGITKGTTAVISAQHDTLYSDMIKEFGKSTAGAYLQANLWALKQFEKLSQNIDCDFEEKPSVIYSLNDRQKMEEEVRAVNSLGFNAEFITELPLPLKIAGGVKFPGMAQFHPLKFISGISKGLNILENTFVQRLEGTTAYTDKGTITAKKVIVCSHFPFINSHGLYFMKLYQKRSFVIALEGAPDIGCTTVDNAEGGIYMRNYKNLLILGGGDHRTGKKGGFEKAREFAARYCPEAKEKYAWANQDCMSLDGIPYIGRYSPNLPDVLVATGFNEWGMTSSMAAACILSDMAAGRENLFSPVFNPSRSMLKPQLAANLGATLIDFITPTAKRCPHLGCALKWNKAEHTWDCPCHGSRFDRHGELIDNPAMRRSHVE